MIHLIHRYYLILLFILLFTDGLALAEERPLVELDVVIITASRIWEPMSGTPASVEVVTHKDIQSRQSLTLDDAVRGITGLNIDTFGGADPAARIAVRGAELNQSIVMIDGVKINNPFSQAPLAGALLLSNAERVEVVKGSYSALYGSEAIGGVVNVITADRPGLTYAINGGSHRTSNASILYSNRHEDIAYTLGYENLSTEGFRFSGPYWSNNLFGKITIPVGASASLQLLTTNWDWKKFDRTICCEFDASGKIVFVLDQDSNVKERNWLNSARLNHYPSGRWDYSIRLSRYSADTQTENSIEPATPVRPFPLEIKSDIYSERDVFDMQHNLYPGERNIVTIGFQYTSEEVGKEEFGNLDSLGLGPSLQQPGADAKRVSRAIYLQEIFKIDDLLSLSGGARIEDGAGFDNKFIPKISALYILPYTGTGFHASYGNGIRAPSLEELYHPVQGNTGLRPENSTSIETGFRQPLMEERIWFEATGFLLKLKDLIDIDDSSTTPVYINIGRSKITGAEAALKVGVNEKLNGGIGIYTTPDGERGHRRGTPLQASLPVDSGNQILSCFTING